MQGAPVWGWVFCDCRADAQPHFLIRVGFSPALGAVGNAKLRGTAPVSGGLERPTVTENHTGSAGDGEMRVVTAVGDQGRLHRAGGI